jgi:nucleoside-diphosphate-sugar epimerase
VLVTGGSGFLGRPLVAALGDSGHAVTAPTRQELDVGRDIVPLDLTVRETGVDTLVHLAHPRVPTTNDALGSALVMLKTVLDVCRQHRLRFVYLSGWEVYSGYKSRELLANESLAPCPGGTYGMAKALGDQMVDYYRARYELTACCLRPGPVYGPTGDKPKFIWNFIEKATTGQPIVAHEYRNGYPALDLVYETDLRAALVAAVERPAEGWYHLGHGRLTSTTAIAQQVIELTGSSSALRHHRLDEDAANIALDAGRAEVALGWRPTIGVKEGIASLLNKYMK